MLECGWHLVLVLVVEEDDEYARVVVYLERSPSRLLVAANHSTRNDDLRDGKRTVRSSRGAGGTSFMEAPSISKISSGRGEPSLIILMVTGLNMRVFFFSSGMFAFFAEFIVLLSYDDGMKKPPTLSVNYDEQTNSG